MTEEIKEMLESLLSVEINRISDLLTRRGYSSFSIYNSLVFSKGASVIIIISDPFLSVERAENLASYFSKIYSFSPSFVFLSSAPDRAIVRILKSTPSVLCIPHTRKCYGRRSLQELLFPNYLIQDPNNLPPKDELYVDVLSHLISILKKQLKNISINHDYFVFRKELESSLDLIGDEILFNNTIISILRSAGFEVHESSNKPGFADIVLLKPLRVVIEVKNERANLSSIDQIIEYVKLYGARIKLGFKGLLVAPSFPEDVIHSAEVEKISLLSLESFIDFLSLAYLIGSRAISYLIPGLCDDLVKKGLAEVIDMLRGMGEALKVASMLGPVKIGVLREVITKVKGDFKDKHVEALLNFLKSLPIKPFSEEYSVILSPYYLLLNIIRIIYLMGAGLWKSSHP